MKPLNIEDNDRRNCVVSYDINRFVVSHSEGWVMFTAMNKSILKSILELNRINNPMFVGIAIQKYLA